MPDPSLSRHCRSLALLAALLPAACATGPDYVRPGVAVPAAWGEAGSWKTAQPRDLEPRGAWWSVYQDPVLARLLDEVDISNQNIALAEARFRQAVAVLEGTRAGLFPALTGGVSNARSRSSATTTATPSVAPVSRGVVTNHSLRLDASWEVDVWGKVQRNVESSVAAAQASAADLAAARLSAQATLAQSYFQLRALDAQKRLYDEIITALERSAQLTRNQYDAGVVARADVVQSQVQLKTAQAQAIELGVQRAQLEHAIAVLTGKPPAQVRIAPAEVSLTPPAVPAALPSELLERRPDIAAAERRVVAANAGIGVAQAAFFPSLTLSAAGGLQSAAMVDWLHAPSRFWSFSAAIAQSIFDAGLRSAQKAQAVAAWEAAVAQYRQTVLTGFQEVEDSLATLRILDEEAAVQAEAVAAARQSLELSLNQYRAGTVSYLQVVVAQTASLQSLRTASDLLARRMTASVQLVKALGGGWETGALPAAAGLPAAAAATRPGAAGAPATSPSAPR